MLGPTVRAQVCNCLLSGVPRLTLTFTSPHMCAPPRSTTTPAAATATATTARTVALRRRPMNEVNRSRGLRTVL